MGKLGGRVAIVSGGGSGIGAAIAAELAREGATVIVADLDLDAAERIAAAATADGGDARAYAVDFLRAGQVTRMVRKVAREHGAVDVLVNVVGGSTKTFVADMSERVWDRMIDLNLKTAFLGARAVIPVMRDQRRGRIINVSSNMGFTGAPGRSHYAAAKAAIIGFTRSLALELAPMGITVNALVPGLTATDRVRSRFSDGEWAKLEASIPLGRAGRPEDMAPMVALLASDAGGYVTGQAIHVNGGLIMP